MTLFHQQCACSQCSDIFLSVYIFCKNQNFFFRKVRPQRRGYRQPFKPVNLHRNN